MTDPDRIMAGINESQATAATTLHLIFRFLRTVRYRSGILVASLVLACVSGAGYYITAPRIYESTASLYIVRKGAVVNQDSSAASESPSYDMPTFIALMSEEEVIRRALQVLPEKYIRLDLPTAAPSQRPQFVRGRLSVSAAFNTNVLDISYRSQNPKAAAAMLTAMLAGYEKFLNETNRSLSEQGLSTLDDRLKDVERQIEELTNKRLELKASAPDLVDTGDRNNSMNVISKNIELLTADYSAARRATEQ